MPDTRDQPAAECDIPIDHRRIVYIDNPAVFDDDIRRHPAGCDIDQFLQLLFFHLMQLLRLDFL
jgi:hypothetical protein